MGPLFRRELMLMTYRRLFRAEEAARAAEEQAYQSFIRQHEVPDPTPFSTQLTLSFLIPAYNTPPKLLQALADSLLSQSCPRWEACFYDGCSPSMQTRQALTALAGQDPRFRVVLGTVNEGISGNTNRAAAFAQGDILALCDHDDLLAPDAVRCILQAAQEGADLIYTDEDKVSQDGTRFFEPHCKPDYAPDALRSGNYMCHITAMTRSLWEKTGGLRSAFDGSQDHDLVLRASERAEKIVHIPRILYHWRMLDTSFSHQKAEKCALAAAHAVQEQLDRFGYDARASVRELRVYIEWATRPVKAVCIVWGMGDIPKLPCPVVRVDDVADLTSAAMETDADMLLFLKAGMRPIDQDWFNALLQYAQRHDVGCVGSGILDGDNVFRHAGYAVNVPGGAVSHQAGQWLYGRPYMLTDRIVRNVTGVSSCLLMVRREVFQSVGGFGEYDSDLRGADLGLKCMQAGYLNVYTPYARFMDRKPLCLMSPAPREDWRRFTAIWAEHPPERYYSPLFRQDGTMFIRFAGKEAVHDA